MNNKLIKYFISALLLAVVACAKTLPVHNPSFSVSSKSLAQVDKAVKAALKKRSWIITSQGKNTISAKYNRGAKYSANVKIDYSATNVSVKLVDSYNLLQGVDESGQAVIHKTYNGWVRNLENDIQLELSYN